MSEGLPDGWKIVSIADFGKVVTGSTPDTKNENYWNGKVPFISPADFTNSVYVKETERSLTLLGAEKGRLLPKNSILVTCIGSLGGISINPVEATTNQQINAVIPNEENNFRYCFYAILQNIKELDRFAGTTTLPIINKSTFEKVRLLRSPLPEQKKIAKILSSVDEVIEITETQINKLKDLKKGLMNELLTKGIGHTEFKDSLVGRIPVGWEVKKLGEICSWIGVGIATSTTHAYVDDGTPILRNQNIKEGKIDSNDLLYISEQFSKINQSKMLQEGDVITVRTGYPGISAVITEKFANCHTFTTLISRPERIILNPDFFVLFINSDIGRRLVSDGQAGGAQQNLNVAEFRKFPVIIPSLNEQLKIFKLVNSISIKIDCIESKLTQSKNLKKSLMADLLTGRVRVKPDKEQQESL